MKTRIATLLFLLLSICADAAKAPAPPFSNGVNLSDWFNMEDAGYLDRDRYTADDFADMKSIGIDVVRLPLNFPPFMGDAPGYTFSDEFLAALDHAVALAEEAGLHVILDQHSYYGSRWFRLDPGEKIVTSGLSQLAKRYASHGDKIVYELFNEPGGELTDALWGPMQQRLIDAVRQYDKNHYIIATGLGCNIANLFKLPRYTDSLLIYTFHYYNPFLFTHQGADWDNSPQKDLIGIPYPYNAATMPAKPQSFVGNTYYEPLYDKYANEAVTDEPMRNAFVRAMHFGRERNAPVFVGEYGTLTTVPDAERCRWYADATRLFEATGIARTAWEWRVLSSAINFGFFPNDKCGIFGLNLDAALAAAAGFDTAAWQPADELWFYRDCRASWWNKPSDVNINLTDMANPASGSACISWKIAGAYSSLRMELWPVADFSSFAADGGYLEFDIASDGPLPRLNVRFVQYKEGAPWQWRLITLVGTDADDIHGRRFKADGQWHHVRVPLAAMWVCGTSGTWKDKPDPGEEGFAYDCVNALEFAAEGQSTIIGTTLRLDNIRLTKN